VPAPNTATNTGNLGFLLAKASQRWNELLYERFVGRGFAEVRPSYGSLLLPLFEEDGLRMGELAERARLSKQTMTTMVRLLERDGLVTRERDATDGRAFRIGLTERARDFLPVAEEVLAELDGLVREALGNRETTALERALKGVIAL
jgi:DNA-binding MarR family transcriptional regulator